MGTPRLRTDRGAEYGYRWYVQEVAGRRALHAAGNGGQRLYVVPDLDLTVAITAGDYDDPDRWRTPDVALERVYASCAR
jgi:CubicO group peptidase (beta-lactamase class C family)